jgi:hypothetical protein
MVPDSHQTRNVGRIKIVLLLFTLAATSSAVLCDLNEYVSRIDIWQRPDEPLRLPRIEPVRWKNSVFNFAWKLLPSDEADGSCDPSSFAVVHDAQGNQTLQLSTIPDGVEMDDPDYNTTMATLLKGAAAQGACRLALVYPPTFAEVAMEALMENTTQYAQAFHVQPCANAMEDGQTADQHWRNNRLLYDFSGRFRAIHGEFVGTSGMRADPTERVMLPEVTLNGVQQMIEDPLRDPRATMTMTCDRFLSMNPEEVGTHIAKLHVPLFHGWAKPWGLRPEGLEEIERNNNFTLHLKPHCRRLFNATFAVDVPGASGPVLAHTIVEVRDMDEPKMQNLPPLADETLMPRQFHCAWEADEFMRRVAARYTSDITADEGCTKAPVTPTFNYVVYPSKTECSDRDTLFRGTWAAEDGCGNAARLTYTIAVHDRIPPMRRTDSGARGVQRCLLANGREAPLDAVHMAPGRVKVFDVAFLVDNIVRSEFEDNCGGGPHLLYWEADWHAVDHLRCTLHLQRPGSPPMTCIKLKNSEYPAIVYRGSVKLPGAGEDEEDEEQDSWDWAQYFPVDLSIGRVSVPVVVSDACGNAMKERTLVDMVFANSQDECDVLGMSTPW